MDTGKRTLEIFLMPEGQWTVAQLHGTCKPPLQDLPHPDIQNTTLWL